MALSERAREIGDELAQSMSYRQWLVGNVAADMAPMTDPDDKEGSAYVADVSVRIADAVLDRLAKEE